MNSSGSDLTRIHGDCELKALKLIPPSLKVFDTVSVSSNEESELSGPFSDFEQSGDFNKKSKLVNDTKLDFYSHFLFSEEFRAAMESAKNESETASVVSEQIQAPIEENEIHKKLRITACNLLRDKDICIETDVKKLESDDLADATPSPKPKTKEEKGDEPTKNEDEFYDTMSGYWRMLSAYNEFRISPPDYNAYENKEPHWLETKPIPFEITESSRLKCLEWLKDNFADY